MQVHIGPSSVCQTWLASHNSHNISTPRWLIKTVLYFTKCREKKRELVNKMVFIYLYPRISGIYFFILSSIYCDLIGDHWDRHDRTSSTFSVCGNVLDIHIYNKKKNICRILLWDFFFLLWLQCQLIRQQLQRLFLLKHVWNMSFSPPLLSTTAYDLWHIIKGKHLSNENREQRVQCCFCTGGIKKNNEVNMQPLLISDNR